MQWHKRWRTRLVAIQAIVVLILFGSMWLIIQRVLPASASVLSPLLLASLVALVVGVLANFLLWRILVEPIRNVADTSQRIAGGQYGERVSVPEESGEALKQLVTNFNQMAQTLEQTEQTRVEMLGNVAHELRTPLAGLKGVIEAIEDGIYAPDSQTFGIMAGEIDRLVRLTDDIQLLSRAESADIHHQLNIQPLNINDILTQIYNRFRFTAEEQGITLTLAKADTANIALGDCDRVTQILTNLLSNGLRYTLEGGSIELRVANDNNENIYIEVADTGIGISAQELPYIFERFYRVDRSRARHSGGSGVGLTIARQLAWLMDGELVAESEEGKGSVFRLVLPKGVME